MGKVIQFEGVSKRYRLGRQHRSLREALTGGWEALVQSLTPGRPGSRDQEFWALQEVTFDVSQGDRLGIIGRNGAGKSTLLKILAQITQPTRGRVTVRGRVASLLEVGTGFHPELTGRENIYLNGSILGMSRQEIKQRFDDIVAFAELERFLDTPVKRYSSGMYVRLAFAVAAHLEPEILIVDEVLAVGDHDFQKKCLGKMETVGREGRTVLFVSHNLATLRRLCNKGVVLEAGQVAFEGDVAAAVERYQQSWSVGSNSERPGVLLLAPEEKGSQARFWIESLELLEDDDSPKERLHTWDPVKIRVRFRAGERVDRGSGVVSVYSLDKSCLLLLSSMPDQCVPMPISPGSGYFDCRVPRWPLAAGTYLIQVGLAIPSREWLCQSELAELLTYPRDVFDSGMPPDSARYLVVTPYTIETPTSPA